MKAYKNLKEIKKECEKVESCVSGSDKFMYKCFPFLIEQLEAINNNLAGLKSALKTRKKREPSAYNLHIAKEMAAGKTMREAVESWKLTKAK